MSRSRRIDDAVGEAMRVGYLRLRGGNQTAYRNAYLDRCRKLKVPITILRLGIRRAKVEVDIEPARRRLTDEGDTEVFNFLERLLGRGKVYGCGGRESRRIEKIPRELGETVAFGLRDYMIANSTEKPPARGFRSSASAGTA